MPFCLHWLPQNAGQFYREVPFPLRNHGIFLNMSYRRNLKKHFYSIVNRSNLARLGIALQRGRLQILAYHGLCLSDDTAFSWLSPAFLSVDLFEKQMAYIRNEMSPITLMDAIELINEKKPLPEGAIAVTFDDGYANNVTYGQAILSKYGIPATIFLSTNYMDSGIPFHFDRLWCLQHWVREGLIDGREDIQSIGSIPDHKTVSIYDFEKAMLPVWKKWKHLMDDDQRRLLSPLTWEMVKNAPSVYSFGGHTKNHTILSCVGDKDRVDEIKGSMAAIGFHTGRTNIPFSYPNGTLNDFGCLDKTVLRDIGCPLAVSVENGSNPRNTDPYALFRRIISSGHGMDVFMAELGGIRKGLMTLEHWIAGRVDGP